MKYTDLPEFTEHISTVLLRVLQCVQQKAKDIHSHPLVKKRKSDSVERIAYEHC
jgi:hypothetical protein